MFVNRKRESIVGDASAEVVKAEEGIEAAEQQIGSKETQEGMRVVWRAGGKRKQRKKKRLHVGEKIEAREIDKSYFV